MEGHFARKELKRRRTAFVRKHWWRLAVMVLGIALLAGALKWLFPHTKVPLWIAVPIAIIGSFAAAREQLDGTYHLSMGLQAESWTSKDLQKSLGPEWRVVDRISFACCDVDHVLVGPRGVYAVETKYTDSKMDVTSRPGRRQAVEWTDQAFDGARSVRLLLQSYGHKLAVTPLVVVWGSEVTGTPNVVTDVAVMRGRDLRVHFSSWHSSAELLSASQVAQIERDLLEYCSRRATYEESRKRGA